MSAITFKPRKSRRVHRHVIRLEFKSPEIRALAPRIEREVRACFNRCLPHVLKAKKAAKKRMAAKRKKSR